MKLKTKLAILLSMVSILPVLIFGAITYFLIRADRVSSATSKLATIAATQEQKINTYIRNVEENFASTVENLEIREIFSSSAKPSESNLDVVRNVLISQKEKSNYFVSLSMVDPAGVVIVSTNPDYEKKTNPFNTSLSFGSEAEQVDIADVDSGQEKIRRVIFTSPLLIKNVMSGEFVAETEISTLNAIVGNYSDLGKTGETVVAKTSNNNLSYLFPSRFESVNLLEKTLPTDSVNLAMGQAMKQIETTFANNVVDYRGVAVISATRFIDTTNWGMVVEMDKSEILSSVFSFQRSLIIYILFAIPATLIVSYFLANSITKPIVQLTSMAEKISEGNYSQKVNLNSKDEIGKLGEVFNLMTTRLTESYGK
jgi:two-component system NtrC family sensor kinase